MSGRSTLFIPLLALCGVAAHAAGDLREEFAWRQTLDGDFAEGGLYRLAVPGAIFDGCRAFPDDLRIIDETGQQWPFFLWTPSEKQDVRVVPSQTLNASVVEKPDRYLRQDLRIAPDPETGRPREHNQVILRTPGRDFIRRVEVYGKEGEAPWAFLGSGYLVDYSRDARAANGTIRYPVSTLPLIQVRVFPNARDATEPLSIDHLCAGLCVTEPGELEPVPLTQMETPKDERTNECQVLVFDTGARTRPVERLTIRADDREYARSVRVSARNDETNVWRWVADGEIHRIGQDVQDAVGVKWASYRFLKLEVFHYDDRPLTNVRVEALAVPRYIVFEAGGGRKPELYYGAKVEAPRYDLERRKGKEALSSAPVAKIEPRTDNVMHEVTWLEKYGRWLAVLAVGAVSVLVLWVVLGMLKRQTG